MKTYSRFLRGRASENGSSNSASLLGYFTIAFVIGSSIPIGSNRPIFWAFNALLLGLALALQLLISTSERRSPAPLDTVLLAAALLIMSVCVWILVQALPLGVGVHPAWSQFPESLSGGAGTISASPSATIWMLLRYVSYATVFFFALRSFSSRRRAEKLLRLLFFLLVLQGLFALISLSQLGDTLLFMPKWEYEGSATGTYVNRNSFATTQAFAAVIGAALIAGVLHGENAAAGGSARRGTGRIGGVERYSPLLAGMAVILAALVASQSRMGLVAGMVGVAVVIVIAAAGHRHAMRLVLAFGSLAVLLLGLMILFDGTGIFERFLFTSKDANFRLELYIKTLDLISLRPLAGQGAGSFLLAFPQVQAPPLNPDLTWDYAHNLYLELGAELGLPAALAVMLAVLLLAGRCLRAALRQSRGWTVPCAAFGVTVVAAVHSLADFSLQIESIVFLFLFVLGAGYAQSGQRKARSRGADSTKDVEFSGLPLDAHRGTPHV